MTATTDNGRHLHPVATPPDPDRHLPHDPDAERCLLGALMVSSREIPTVTSRIRAGDFYQPRHSRIYQAITDQYLAGQPTHPHAITVRLTETGDITGVGGAAYLHTLVESFPVAASAGWYANRVEKLAVLRRLLETSTHIAQLAHSERGLADIITAAHQALHDATTRHTTTAKPTAWADIVGPAIDAIEQAADTGGRTRGLPTGLADLDTLTSGLQPGQLVVVACRPGVGKSVMAVNLARTAAMRHGHPTLLISLEMTQEEIVHRVLSAEASIPLHLIREGKLADDEWVKLIRTQGELGDAPLHIDDTATVSIVDIRAKAQLAKHRYGIQLLIVDYLQLATPSRRTENRQLEVTELSRGLKLLAKDLQIPVVALSQLNRGPEGRADKRPNLADLRESGALEQDADTVWLLHRPDYYDKEDPRAGEIDVIVAKNRNGATDTVTAAAQLHLSRFVDMSIAAPPADSYLHDPEEQP